MGGVGVVGRPTHAGVDKVEGVLGGGWEGGGGGGGRVIGGGGWGAWAFDGYGRPWVGAVEFHFGKVCVEGALFFGKALEEENGFVRASGRANHVTVVEEAELVYIWKLLLDLVEDGMEGEGKQPGPVRVALPAAVGRGDVVFGVLVGIGLEVGEGGPESVKGCKGSGCMWGGGEGASGGEEAASFAVGMAGPVQGLDGGET